MESNPTHIIKQRAKTKKLTECQFIRIVYQKFLYQCQIFQVYCG